MESNTLHSIDKINDIYNNLSYLDIYGGSVLLFICITLFIISIWVYFHLLVNAQAIKDDWVNQRCNPKVMPFAGLINKPDNKTITEFTGENFNYCTQTILSNLTGIAVQPFQYLTNYLLSIFQGFLDSINKIRDVFTNLRTNMQNIAENILQRILNVMIPLQRIFMAMMDSLQKAQGVLTASLFTSLGSYYTLKALLGAIVELIVKMLIVLVAIIVGLWVLPFTWPAAGAMSAVFLAIAIPLAIIVGVMTEVLHIQSSGIPKLKCFDAKTMLKVNKKLIQIKNIKIGETIENENNILGKIKLMSENEDFYNYNNIVISGSHKVFENNKWILIKDSIFSKKINNYNEKYIYCLITQQKLIKINDHLFLDWDEYINNSNFSYGGFNANCLLLLRNKQYKLISNIEPGDILENGEIVYGVIELDPNILILNNKSYFSANIDDRSFCYFNDALSIFKTTFSNTLIQKDPELPDKIYHLLTSTGSFYIGKQLFSDYNNMTEHLQPMK